MATKTQKQSEGRGNTPMPQANKGNGGNDGNSKGFDEQHGARGTQLNANTTANSGKTKDHGGAGPRKKNMMNNKKGN